MANLLLLAACIGEWDQALTHLRVTGAVNTPAGERLFRELRVEFIELVARWPGDDDESRVVAEARTYATERQHELNDLLSDELSDLLNE